MRNPERLYRHLWPDAEKQAAQLFFRERIARGLKPILFIERQGDQVVGAVAAGMSRDRRGDYFSFDVVVSSDHHRKGIGKQLIKAVDTYYETMKYDLMPGIPRAKIEVINPVVEKILTTLGYHYHSIRDQVAIMEKY